MIDELLGRLEASTVKFDIGRGGIPQLTPQDIDTALGLCADKNAVAIYRAARGGTIADWSGLDRLLGDIQLGEWRNRMDRMVTAQLARAQVAWAPIQLRASLAAHAEMLMSGAKAAMWPSLTEMPTYAAMRKALIAELRSDRICSVCCGRGSVIVESTIAQCSNCLGMGRVAVSDRQRALMLNVAWSSYRAAWRPVYEWMYRELCDAIPRGRAQFSEALGRIAA